MSRREPGPYIELDATPDERASRKPQPPNTCGRCDAEWTGVRACHCSGCHRTFAGISAFDSHRGSRSEHGECRDVAAMSGLEFRDGMWRGPEMPEGLKEQRRAEVTR